MSQSEANTPIQSVAILGSGMAAWMMAADLSRHVPSEVKITVYGEDEPPWSDALYGSVLPPEFYSFHSSLGLDEPTLLNETDAGFCFGTWISNWGEEQVDWVQAFHQPLMMLGSVPLGSFIAQQADASLQPLLISAVAARAGRFAHPPEDPNHPLSRAEYGYMISATELSALYKRAAKNVAHHKTSPKEARFEDDRFVSIQMRDGTDVAADLYINATGADHPLNAAMSAQRAFGIAVEKQAAPQLGSAVKTIKANTQGWTSEAATRSQSIKLTVTHSSSATDDRNGRNIRALENQTPWQGNMISIGQAACTIEPLSVAPMRLLLKDVQRVAELFPVSTDMRIEARDYNRAALEAQENGLIFHYAHMREIALPETAYWQESASWTHPKLTRLIRQFNERGASVSYDNALFYPADWAILHDGLRRKPRRADALTAQGNGSQNAAQCQNIITRIRNVVQKMPPHAVYMTKLLDYLERTKTAQSQSGQRHVG